MRQDTREPVDDRWAGGFDPLGDAMQGLTEGGKSAARFQNLLIFLALVVLGFLFFSPVRNNPFWHPDDYEYLTQVLRIEHNGWEIFAAIPHDTFQPLVNLIFYLEFQVFGLVAWKYYAFNVLVHSVNAFLVYVLVQTLLRDRPIAVLSGLLFAFAVGNYGKAVMVASGISDLVITTLTLLTMFFYIRNELRDKGRLRSLNFAATLVFYFLLLLSKTTSFSVLGCMLAFNLFFRQQTGRRVFDKNFLVIAASSLVVLVVKISFQGTIPGTGDLVVFGWSPLRNLGSYLVRMVFPIHYSSIVEHSGPIVRFIYRLAEQIRVFIFLCIVSYSVFGFVFGNKVIRFFIAWTYITVAPFCFFYFPADWLNIRYLYLVSVGFVMILASGTVLAGRLLIHRSWRRLLPYVIPLFFVLLSHFVIIRLDASYEHQAKSERIVASRKLFVAEWEKTRGGPAKFRP